MGTYYTRRVERSSAVDATDGEALGTTLIGWGRCVYRFRTVPSQAVSPPGGPALEGKRAALYPMMCLQA